MRHRDDANRIPYLIVVASTNQMYSGTGVALFEWMKFASKYFDFSICIDNHVALNYKITRDFCLENDFGFFPSGPYARDGAPDPGVFDAQYHVSSNKWKIIEILSWANTCTNLDVVSSLPDNVLLIFTPHTQPLWTLPSHNRFHLVEKAFDRVLMKANLVSCDSPAEVNVVRNRVNTCQARFLPISIDTDRFNFCATERKRRLLTVADFNEPRKRADLNIAAIIRFVAASPHHSAVIAGTGSQSICVPEDVRERVELVGYVSEDELLSLYQSSSVFLILTDFEAFCIPIVEALACGTPVVATATEELTSLYSDQLGCSLVDNQCLSEIDEAIKQSLSMACLEDISIKARKRFGREAVCRQKLEIVIAEIDKINAPGVKR